MLYCNKHILSVYKKKYIFLALDHYDSLSLPVPLSHAVAIHKEIKDLSASIDRDIKVELVGGFRR